MQRSDALLSAAPQGIETVSPGTKSPGLAGGEGLVEGVTMINRDDPRR